MLINRWLAPQAPTTESLLEILKAEGLEPVVEVLQSKQKVGEHRHPFGEVRIILKGEMLFTIAGNQILLRPGDRVELGANTRHWHQAHGNDDCESLFAYRYA
jgi:quercetin dioxygenase-like cupin family protein